MKFPMKDFLVVKKSQIEIEIFLQLLQTFLMKQNRKFKILKIGKKINKFRSSRPKVFCEKGVLNPLMPGGNKKVTHT